MEVAAAEAPAESAKKEPKHKFNGFEFELMINILNSRGGGGGSIKDLKVVENTVKALKAAMPVRPERPNIRPLAEGEKEYPKAEMEEFQKTSEEWGKQFDAYLNDEVGCELNDTSCLVVKQKLQAFGQFNSDEGTRARILKLAEKFGI